MDLDQRTGQADSPWIALCEKRRCKPAADQASSGRWTLQMVNSRAFRTRLAAFFEAHPLPLLPEPSSTPLPLYAQGSAPGPLIYFDDKGHHRLTLDGTAAERLEGLSNNATDLNVRRGRAWGRSTLSPDHRTLAHVDAKGLHWVDVQQSPPTISPFLPPDQTPLIHSWSPSGRHLLAFVRKGKQAFVGAPGKSSPVATFEGYGLLLGWFDDDHLLDQQAAGEGVKLFKRPLDGGPTTEILSLERGGLVYRADVRQGTLVYARQRGLVALRLAEGTSKVLGTRQHYALTWFALSPDGSKLLARPTQAGEMHVIDTSTAEVLHRIDAQGDWAGWYSNDAVLVGRRPKGLAVITLDGRRLDIEDAGYVGVTSAD